MIAYIVQLSNNVILSFENNKNYEKVIRDVILSTLSLLKNISYEVFLCICRFFLVNDWLITVLYIEFSGEVLV